MAVLRQANLLGDQRIDVPHLRAIESATAADFDVVAGRVQAGGKALIVRGFELSNYTVGTSTSSVQLNTADGVLYNQNATESGTFLWVPLDRPVEVLDSALNARVDGSFVAGAVNYIGVDLVRSTDATTTDHVKFLDANTLLEQGYEVPLARTLDYRIVITSTPFSALPHLTPVAKVTSDANNQVVTVEDARNIMWRLGSGGDFPDSANGFSWPQDRVEVAGAFSGGDKGIRSQKDWQDAVMSRVWEIGGGENWYSPTADRNFKLVGSPTAVFISTGDNFEWQTGLYGVSHLHWQGLQFLFENSNNPGIYYNTIADQLVDDPSGSAATSRTALAPGECLYVDLDRTTNATLTAQKATMQNLGEPAVPGSRVIIVWRNADGWFRRDGNFAAHTLPPSSAATVADIGTVRLAYAAGTPLTPTVPPLNANNAIRIGEGSYPVAAGVAATYGFSASGYGLEGASTSSHGVHGTGATGVYGIGGAWTHGALLGAGITGASDALVGVRGCSAAAEGVYGVGVTGVYGLGDDVGVYGSGPTGVYGSGSTYGVYGTGTTYGVYGIGSTYGIQGATTGGTLPTPPFGTKAALYGSSAGDIGVYGISTLNIGGSFRGQGGVLGYDTGLGSAGVSGVSDEGDGVSGQALGAGMGGVFVGATGVKGTGTSRGVWGVGSSSGAGVRGESGSGAGVEGVSSTGVGGQFTGNATRSPINLGSMKTSVTRPTSGVTGDMFWYVDTDTTTHYMAVCVESGTPGFWRYATLSVM